MSIDLNMSNNLTNSITSNISEDKEKRWKLIPQIEKGLNDLINQNNSSNDIKNLKTSLDKMKELKNKINEQEKELKLGKLIALKERNGYLQKLRQIEEIGSNYDWEDEEGFLKELSELLYN